MAGYDFRTKPVTANDLSFYLFDNLKMQESGEGGNVYRFDTMKEAITVFRMIRIDRPSWTIALGGSVGGGREIDFIQVREGGINVLIDDFKHIDFWKDRADVAQAIEEFAAGPGIEWQTDRELLGGPILIPYARDNAYEDPVLADKALLPANPSNALTSISEAFVEGEGWVSCQQLEQLIKNQGRSPDERPKVSRLNVAYETIGKNGEERGGSGYIDIKPAELYGMIDRYHELKDIREQEPEGRLITEEKSSSDVFDGALPDTRKPFFNYHTSYGETEKVNIQIAAYSENDNLYVGMDYFDLDLGGIDFYGDVTVNILQLPPFMAAIDTNNNNAEKIMNFLIQNEFGKLTGGALPSGFCMYPVFRFDEEKLAEADPRGFKRYCQIVGIEPKQRESVEETIDDLKKQAKERAGEKNAERSANSLEHSEGRYPKRFNHEL